MPSSSSSSSTIPGIVPVGSKSIANKKKNRPTFRPGGNRRQTTTDAVSKNNKNNNITSSLSRQQPLEETSVPTIKVTTNEVTQNVALPALVSQSQSMDNDVSMATTTATFIQKISDKKDQSSSISAIEITGSPLHIDKNDQIDSEHVVGFSQVSTFENIAATENNSLANDVLTTQLPAPTVQTKLTSTSSKIRRRPISLSRLDAARKQKKKKIIGVPIGSAPEIRDSGDGDFKNKSEFSQLDQQKNEEDGNQKSASLKLLSSVSASSSTGGVEDNSEGPHIDLSHHPLIQVPQEIPQNTSDKPTMAAFCSKFKLKKETKTNIKMAIKNESSRKRSENSNNPNGLNHNSTFPDNNNKLDQNHDVGSATTVGLSANKGPVVQIVNGEIVLQESSLDYYENNNANNSNYYDDSTEAYTVVEEESQLAIINATCTSFLPEHKQRASNTWNACETLLYYRALRQVGTDFGMMEAYFRNEGQIQEQQEKKDKSKVIRPRTRKQLKRKYQMELVKNPALVEKAMQPDAKLNIGTIDLISNVGINTIPLEIVLSMFMFNFVSCPIFCMTSNIIQIYRFSN
jgi:Myb DNA-binding like